LTAFGAHKSSTSICNDKDLDNELWVFDSVRTAA
jgi:hypothetical protein